MPWNPERCVVRMESTTRALVAIAAAVAGGCVACLDDQLREARQVGVPEVDIAEAVAMAESI